jgi:hypothetical protein
MGVGVRELKGNSTWLALAWVPVLRGRWNFDGKAMDKGRVHKSPLILVASLWQWSLVKRGDTREETTMVTVHSARSNTQKEKRLQPLTAAVSLHQLMPLITAVHPIQGNLRSLAAGELAQPWRRTPHLETDRCRGPAQVYEATGAATS